MITQTHIQDSLDFLHNTDLKSQILSGNFDNTDLLKTGISLLLIFIQENISGPTLGLNRTSSESLEQDGEDVITYLFGSEYLATARLIFIDNFSSIQSNQEAWLWRARYAFLHQQVLSHQIESLQIIALESFQNALQAENTKSIKALILVEYSRCLLYYLKYDQSEQVILEAQRSAGLSFNLTGKLGVRTKFQTKKTAQLVLETISSSDPSEESLTPILIALDEDNPMHETPQLDEPNLDEASVVDQVILLAWVNFFFKTKPKDELQSEVIASYLDKILEKSRNWLVYSLGLLYRSKNQFDSYKFKERSAIQIQTLVDQYKDEAPEPYERLQYVFSLNYPLRHWIKVELGEMFMKLGATMSAFQELETVEMWEEAVECLVMSNYSGKAEKLAKERLEIKKTPRMLCALGDITKDINYYEQAWNLSGHRYSRAQRSLARHEFEKHDYPKAIDHFKLALDINPLYSSSWFTLGCAQMRLQRWEDACASFQKLVCIDGTVSEGWNNLAASYIQLDKYPEAFTAMYHGVQHDRSNWKMWENLLILSIQVGKIPQTIETVRNLLRLNQNRLLDEKVFRVLNGYAKEHNRWHEMERLYNDVVNKITVTGRVWKTYADFVKSSEEIGERLDIERIIALRLKACRAVANTPNWQNNEILVQDLILFVNELCQEYQRVIFI